MELAKDRDLRLAAGAAVIAAYLALVLFWVLRHPGGDAAAARFIGVAHVLPAFGAAVLCFRLGIGRAGLSTLGLLGWRALGVGSLAFAVAQGAASYDRLVGRVPAPFPGFFDCFYLLAYPCLFAGFMALALERGSGSRPRVLLDSLISLGAVGALSWYFVLKPLLGSGPFDLAVAVRLAFPILDLGILYWTLVLNYGPVPAHRAAGLRLLGSGAAFLAVTDTAYAYLTKRQGFAPIGLLDIGWAFGFALLGLGTFSLGCADTRPEEGSAARRWDLGAGDPWTIWATLRVILPVLATMAAVVAMMWVDHHRPPYAVSFDVIGVSFALVISMMGRQVLTLVESGQLHSHLHVFNRRLEEKVQERTHQIQTLHEIARAANSSLRVEEVLEQVLQRVTGALRAEAGAVWLVEDPSEPVAPLRLCGQIGLDPAAHAPLLETVPARWRNGLREVLAERHSLPVPFLAPDGARNENGTAPECLCAAIQWQGRALGVLGALRWEERFGDTERNLLEAVALEVASSLQNAHLYDLAVRAADRDGVTNLLNHRAVVHRLDEECKRADRTGQSMSVLLLDLNNFKLFNDTHGHLVGDQVLKTTASLLNACCRATDVIGRYGGDEFIVICPATGGEGARDLAARIHERMSEATVQGTGGERLPLAGSIGLAVYPEGAKSQFDLLALADMNMYEAKARGGPSIVGCESEEERPADYAGGFSVLDALVTAVDKRDHYTRRHSEDVTEYSLMLAEQLGLSQDTMRTLRFAGLLHDLGKIAIPDTILRKPSALTPEEFEVMKQHPVFGWLIVGAIPSLSETLPAVRHHHERFDGKGYPDGLTGTEIPLLGRLMAVADAFSAMTTDRPYRKGMPQSEAIERLRQGSGTQFDPAMVEAFFTALARKPRAA